MNTPSISINAAVPMIIAPMLIQEMMLIALVDFFALKYRHAKRKGRFKFEI